MSGIFFNTGYFIPSAVVAVVLLAVLIMAVRRYGIGKPQLLLAGVMLLAVTFAANDYSYSHPYTFHDCRLMQTLCPSHDAEWVPPGGSNPSARYLYGLCACSAGLHATVGH